MATVLRDTTLPELTHTTERTHTEKTLRAILSPLLVGDTADAWVSVSPLSDRDVTLMTLTADFSAPRGRELEGLRDALAAALGLVEAAVGGGA